MSHFETALEAKALSVARSGKTVLNSASFAIQTGQVFALLGGNGAGKSTTLLTFLGLLSPKSGSVSVLGQDVRQNLKSIRAKIAYLPEAATLYEHLNAYENIGYFMSLAKIKASKFDVDAAFDTVALQADARAQRLDSYSKGMRQKTAIALALLRNTPILLLDEPTSGLDPIAIDEFNVLVRELAREGKTVFMVTHDVYGACRIADKIALLRSGEMIGSFEREGDTPIDPSTVHAAFAGRNAA